MPTIHVLDPHLAAKIAAGEVIERPASVVKELVENALDAGSRSIRVEIDGGGLERIEITDDGCGIHADQVELAFRRHATSKLAAEEDLNRLQTLGFRGEALPSIAAVSDITCLTRSVDERVGTEYRIEEGALSVQAVARQVGTTMVVSGLFGRFPARKKFMRSRGVEAAACVQAITPLALAFPAVQFSVRTDGREALRTPGDGSPRSAAVAVLGAEADQHLVDVPETALEQDDGSPIVRVTGLCGTGSLHRANRLGLHLLVNRRPVQNRALAFAVSEAYGSLIPVGRHPVGVMDVWVPPGEVDFNVHPSKLEVKLLRERAVYAAIQRALRAALAAGGWSMAAWGTPDTSTDVVAMPWDGPSSAQQLDHFDHAHHAEPGGNLLAGGERLEELRLLGQVARTYIIAEGDAGMYLVDQHAAHERVLLEELRESLAGRSEQQLLLEPLVVNVPAEAAALAEQATTEIRELGFDLESFGPRQVLLRAVPAVLAARNPERALAEALTALSTNSHGLQWDPSATWKERLALVLACKTAVRAGDEMREPEMRALLRRLGEAALARTCAHGRPTAILLSHTQLEREFGRR